MSSETCQQQNRIGQTYSGNGTHNSVKCNQSFKKSDILGKEEIGTGPKNSGNERTQH